MALPPAADPPRERAAEDEAAVLALLAEEFFMTEGQVLLRSDAAGGRTLEGVSFPYEGLCRRLGPERARRVAELQRDIAERFDSRPERGAAFRDRAEAASPDDLSVLHREMARDPFFRESVRRAVEIFFLFYASWEDYIATVHPGAAKNPEAFPKEAAEAREHYRRMEAARAHLERPLGPPSR